MPYIGFEELLEQKLQRLKRQIEMGPIILGGVAASGGGVDGRPGGYLGRLSQLRVTYDKSEVAASSTTGSPTLVDNLNHIRYRTQVLENGTVAIIKNDGSVVASGVTILDFGAEFGVTESPAGEANISIDDIYLLVDGSRALTGAWDMNNQIITNINIDSGEITGITDLAIADGGTGASSAINARTNLGLVAGGTGDIWVEKVGDSMTGPLLIDTNNAIAFRVEQNGIQDDTFVVNTATGFVGIREGSPLARLDIDCGTGTLEEGIRLGTNFSTIYHSINVLYHGGQPLANYIAFSIHDAGGADSQKDVLWILGSGRVSVGSSTAHGKFHITGTSDERQFIVQANASQNVNVAEWWNSSDGVDISFLNGGAVFNVQGNNVDFIIGGDTEPNLVRLDGGLDELRLGDWDTNFFTTNKLGDTWWVGGGGLLIGEIYAHAVTDVVTSVAQNDWDQIVAFDTNGEYNGTTPDHTNDHIIILTAGKYFISFTWNGFGPTVAHDWDFHISKNDNAAQFNNITAHITTPITQKTSSVSCSGFADLAINDTIELWIKRTSAGANIDLTTVHCTISLTLVAGT